MFRYSNLRFANLLEIKDKYPELDLAFKFLDKLTLELKKVSLEQQNTNTIIFIDYNNYKRYFVNIDLTNKILKSCYEEFFFKIVLSEVNKKINIVLIWNNDKWLDIFSKNLFIVMKNFFLRKKNKQFSHYFFISVIINSSLPDFTDVTEFNQYCNHLKKRLQKISFYRLNRNFKDYFPFSYETFFFSKQENGNNYCRLHKYFDLDRYLKSKLYLSDSFIIKIDKSIQLIILICFLNAKFVRIKNQYYDNSYILELINSEKNPSEIEIENYKECLHFNNLLKIIVK